MKLASHLNPDIFSDSVEKSPNRIGYGEGLLAAGEQNERVVALAADLTGSTKTNMFADRFPDRFVQVGIAEQNMASVASGMAAMGKIPFIASYAMFSPGRSWEQVRTTIAYNESNVKIIGAHAGVSVGPDGATHQAIEDMAIMRVIPNMIVIAPCDVHEAKKAVMWAAEYEGPVYIRVAREATEVITTEASEFTMGKGAIFGEPDDGLEKRIAIVATGPVLFEALKAGKELNESGIGTTVVNMPTVKPLDTELLATLGTEHETIVTVEEHQRAGGLGGAVSEYYAEVSPKRVVKVGVDDRFGESGTIHDLYEQFGLDAAGIVKRVHEVVS